MLREKNTRKLSQNPEGGLQQPYGFQGPLGDM